MDRDLFNNFYIVLTLIFKREEDAWTAECKELGTAAFGDTLEEARESIKEAVGLHLNTLEDVGERKRFFEEQGIEIFAERPKHMFFPEMPYEPDILVSRMATPFNTNLINLACT